jgi:hypothetical protein
MSVIKLNSYIIKITKAIAYMPVDRYIQTASMGPRDRFYVNRGAAGGLSISAKNVEILACGIAFIKS